MEDFKRSEKPQQVKLRGWCPWEARTAEPARPEGHAEERPLPGSRPLLGQAAGQLRRQRRRGFAGRESGLRRLALLAQGLQHTGRFCYRRGRRGSQGVCGERKGQKRGGSHFRRPPPNLLTRGSCDKGFLFPSPTYLIRKNLLSLTIFGKQCWRGVFPSLRLGLKCLYEPGNIFSARTRCGFPPSTGTWRSGSRRPGLGLAPVRPGAPPMLLVGPHPCRWPVGKAPGPRAGQRDELYHSLPFTAAFPKRTGQ